MVDSTFGWAMGHPIGFVAVLCLVAVSFAAMVTPRCRQTLHRDHPRC